MTETSISEKMNLLSAETRAEIDHWLTKFPEDQKRSATLAALHAAQEQNGGWLSEPLMEAVAEYLELPRIAVFEVATFYDMFETEPVGKHKINICTNVSCMLCGAEKVLDHVKNRLGIEVGETTKDGLFTLKEVECLAACDAAPMCQIDEKQCHSKLTIEKMDQLIDKLENESR